MDDIAACRNKVTHFRIRELKEVLHQLNLSKQGRKQDLAERILTTLADDQGSKLGGWGANRLGKDAIMKIINETYRKMQAPGAAELAGESNSESDFNYIKPKEEVDIPSQTNQRVRCICGSSMLVESMIQCEDPQCQVWQHVSCVIIPEKPMENGSPEIPSCFYCEMCRLTRADPFWVSISHPLLPVKFTSCNLASDGTSSVQSVERLFQLSRADRLTIQKPEYDLQVWCILLNDKVQFRMQWPQYVDLHFNGVQVRVIQRPGSQLLGINGRDDGPLITTISREASNKICLTRCDARTFCFGVRIAKKRTVQQVLSLIPKEGHGETFADALARVRRCIGGGNASEDQDVDSDLEVVAESVSVNLRCPMSGSRVKVAGRFKRCVHMGCFDLDTFVELNQRSRKWQCPICLKNYSYEDLIIDPYFNKIAALLQFSNEDANEIDVKPDGSWRAKGEIELKELARWHFPDGSLVPVKENSKPDLGSMKQLKLDGASDGHSGLKLGIKRNRDGLWEVSKPTDKRPLSLEMNMPDTLENKAQNILRMSSSPTGSFRDGEDSSVNQDGGVHIDLSLNSGHEFESVNLNFDQLYSVEERVPQQMQDPDIIILSDSEDNNPVALSSRPNLESGPMDDNIFPFAVKQPLFSERLPDESQFGTNEVSTLGLFDDDENDYEINHWPIHPGSQPGQSFHFFGTDDDVNNAMVHPHNSIDVTTSADYGFASAGDAYGSLAPDLPNCHNASEAAGSLVDNPLAFGCNDPSLQILFPARPLQPDTSRTVTDTATRHRSDDWISLSLAAGCHDKPADASLPVDSQPQLPSKVTRKETFDAGLCHSSALLGMNEERRDRTSPNVPSVDNIFSHPRQPRSARSKLFFPVDNSGSE